MIQLQTNTKSLGGYAFIGSPHKGTCFGTATLFFKEMIHKYNYKLNKNIYLNLQNIETIQYKYVKKNYDADIILKEQFLQSIPLITDVKYSPAKILNLIYDKYCNNQIGGYSIILEGENTSHIIAFFITKDSQLLYANSNNGIFLMDDIEEDLKLIKEYLDTKKYKYKNHYINHILKSTDYIFQD